MTHIRPLETAPHARRGLFFGLWVVAALAGSGCGSTSQSQLTRLQAEKKELLNRIVDEQKRTETLTAELRDANLRAAEAEKQLARLYDDPRGRLAGTGSSGFSPYAAAPRPLAAGSVGASELSSQRAARPPIGLGAPRDVARDYPAGADAAISSPSATRSSRGDSFDSSGRDGVDLTGPRNGAGPTGWVPKSR